MLERERGNRLARGARGGFPTAHAIVRRGMDPATTAAGLVRSGSAATLAQLVRILALQATHIVVRRLVLPAEFGIWNWLEIVFLFLATVRDLGVPAHVVRLRPMPLGTLLRVQLGWGALLGAGVVLAAPILALAYHEPSPQLVLGLRVLVVYLLLEGAAAVALTWFEATLRIERTLPAELARTFAYCAVVLAGSFAGLGFWSFVVAQIAGQAFYAALLWRRAWGELRLVHAPGSTVPIVRASLPVGTVWLLATAVTYVDQFVVGGLFGGAALGLYAFAYGYAFLVTRILQQPIGRSLYPALVAYAADRAAQFRAFRLATVLFLAIEVPTALLLAANAELVTRLLAGDNWLAGAPLLALLAFAPVVDPLGRFGGELLLARHHDRARLVALALQLLVLVAGGVALSLALDSPAGMAWANFAPVGTIVVLVVLARHDGAAALVRLGRELAEVFFVPLAPFALAVAATPGGGWARLAASAAAALLALGWFSFRRGGEWRAFLRGSSPG
jgi:O-antigen/teichoic acid export membrane protein